MNDIYEEKILNEIEEIKTTSNPIIIFGTMAMGIIGKKVLDYLNVDMACFCDNSEKNHGKIIDGKPVLSPKDAKKKFENSMVIICSFNDDSVEIINKQLFKLGYTNIKTKDVLLFTYQIEIMDRKISKKDLANTLNSLSNKKNKLILKSVNLSITSLCSLNCKHCGALMPYFKEPKHIDKESIIKSLQRISEAVDAIRDISIFGGEPLLHPDLDEICEMAGKLKNVANIRIITNGTIEPQNHVMNSLRKTVLYMVASDYGELSNKIQYIQDILNKTGIYLEITEKDRTWINCGNLIPRNRSREFNEMLFRNCSHLTDCHLIVNNEYHFCSRSAHGTLIGAIPKDNRDFVDLLDSKKNSLDIREEISNFVSNTKSITACDYCDWVLDNKVTPAIQVDKMLNFDE